MLALEKLTMLNVCLNFFSFAKGFFEKNYIIFTLFLNKTDQSFKYLAYFTKVKAWLEIEIGNREIRKYLQVYRLKLST